MGNEAAADLRVGLRAVCQSSVAICENNSVDIQESWFDNSETLTCVPSVKIYMSCREKTRQKTNMKAKSTDLRSLNEPQAYAMLKSTTAMPHAKHIKTMWPI